MASVTFRGGRTFAVYPRVQIVLRTAVDLSGDLGPLVILTRGGQQERPDTDDDREQRSHGSRKCSGVPGLFSSFLA